MEELFSLDKKEYFLAQVADFWQIRLLRETIRENTHPIKIGLKGKKDPKELGKKTKPKREAKKEKNKSKTRLEQRTERKIGKEEVMPEREIEEKTNMEETRPKLKRKRETGKNKTRSGVKKEIRPKAEKEAKALLGVLFWASLSTIFCCFFAYSFMRFCFCFFIFSCLAAAFRLFKCTSSIR